MTWHMKNHMKQFQNVSKSDAANWNHFTKEDNIHHLVAGTM